MTLGFGGLLGEDELVGVRVGSGGTEIGCSDDHALSGSVLSGVAPIYILKTLLKITLHPY